MLKIFKKKPIATQSDVGREVGVVWNGEDVSHLDKKPFYRWGIIDEVWDCGGFHIDFGDAGMICPAVNKGVRINPFKGLKLKTGTIL